MHANIDGVIMHLRNKQDDDHNHINNQYEAVGVIQDSENPVPEVSKDTKTDVSEDTSEPNSEPDQQASSSETPPNVEEPDNGEAVFDEPSGRGVQSTDVELPCGHESLDPSELPDREILVSCTTCGDEWAFQK